MESRGSSFRVRIRVAGSRHTGPWRGRVAAAEADLRELEAARDASADMSRAVAQLHTACPEAKAQRAEEYIEERRGTFRAHFKKSGHTYSGPRRTLKAEAVEDAKQLLASAGISIVALQAAEARLRQHSGAADSSLEKAVREAMLHWLQQGSTADLRGCSRSLKTRMRRAAAGSEQGQIFEAAKQLVNEHLAIERFALEVSARWMRDLGLQWRLDYNSRPRGTSGVTDRFWHTGLRNLGNSCFLNAVVQCILACQPLQQNFGSHGTERAVAQMHGRCGAAAPERGVGLHSSVVFASSDVPH